jgi:NitT/TauT family transport system substrate-binding protein
MSNKQLTRREFMRLAALAGTGLAATSLLNACAPAPAAIPTPPPATSTPLPPPETTAIRLAIGACDLPMVAAERYLRDEGFTDVQFSDSAALAALMGGKADLGAALMPALATAVDAGRPVVGLGGLHPGCAQIWAPQNVATLKDLPGRTVVVRSKTPADFIYAFLAISLKNTGVDPGSVNFVVQSDADLTKLFLDGKNDALLLLATDAVAFQTNTANKGHIVMDQAMDAPWSQEDCCVLATTTEWVKANPSATKRALRAIYRAADAIPADRADAAKLATDKGLFGGAQNVALVRSASNMVRYDWRKYDVAESMRFHAKLLNEVGLLKMTADESATKATDLRIWRQLQSEITR